MKKTLSGVLILLLILSLVPAVFADNPENPESFYTVMSEAASFRKEQSGSLFEDGDQFRQADSNAESAITQQEADILLNKNELRKEVSSEQAKKDVDLCFRALHAAYGAYYYFGAGQFDKAEEEVLTWLSGKESVAVSELENRLRLALEFMRDGHSFVAVPYVHVFGRFHSYVSENLVLEKGEDGYFLQSSGRKWLALIPEDAAFSIRRVLLSSGDLLYVPVMTGRETDPKPQNITLVSEDGERREEDLQWTILRPYKRESSHEPDYRMLSEGGIVYLSMRCFEESKYPEIYQSFVESGKTASGADAVIVDLRSNGGGNGESMKQWAANFTGQNVSTQEYWVNRASLLRSYEGVRTGMYSPAKKIKAQRATNTIPLIVLVDENCGSAGESAMNLLKNIDNAVVIGSSSAGYQLGGNTVQVTLPETGIPCSIGTELRFVNTVDNVDLRGYEPDIWCDPQEALHAALRMLAKYRIAEESQVEELINRIEETENGTGADEPHFGDELTLRFMDAQVQPDSGFGASKGTHVIYPCVNGEPVAEYSYTLENDSLSCRMTEDGGLEVTVVGEKNCWMTFVFGGQEYHFYWIVNPFG